MWSDCAGGAKAGASIAVSYWCSPGEGGRLCLRLAVSDARHAVVAGVQRVEAGGERAQRHDEGQTPTGDVGRHPAERQQQRTERAAHLEEVQQAAERQHGGDGARRLAYEPRVVPRPRLAGAVEINAISLGSLGHPDRVLFRDHA